MINAHFVGDNVRTSSPLAFSMYEKSRWGEKKNGFVEFSGVETLYFVERNKTEVFSGKKKIGFDELLRKFKKKDKKIETKLAVFSDLRSKGYIVKTALKFGAEFRVYDKGVKPGTEHAKWIVYCVKENEQMSWHDFAAKNRVAHSTKKNLLICVVDEEGGVSYYEVGWIRV
ncbi:MAG: tRNA-intron lyase [Nanoarchaeota archaeon]|nr:tRNA-intron lyase [Nanoarchaeota archaeon]